MATLLLLFLHAIGKLNSDYDCYFLVLIVALDSSTLLRWWIWRHQRL